MQRDRSNHRRIEQRKERSLASGVTSQSDGTSTREAVA
jgi:hypothetical protein